MFTTRSEEALKIHQETDCGKELSQIFLKPGDDFLSPPSIQKTMRAPLIAHADFGWY